MLIGDSPQGAYVSCPRCGRPVADGLVRCSGCGMRILMGVAASRALLFLTTGAVLGLLVGGISVVWITGLGHSPAPTQVPAIVVPGPRAAGAVRADPVRQHRERRSARGERPAPDRLDERPAGRLARHAQARAQGQLGGHRRDVVDAPPDVGRRDLRRIGRRLPERLAGGRHVQGNRSAACMRRSGRSPRPRPGLPIWPPSAATAAAGRQMVVGPRRAAGRSGRTRSSWRLRRNGAARPAVAGPELMPGPEPSLDRASKPGASPSRPPRSDLESAAGAVARSARHSPRRRRLAGVDRLDDLRALPVDDPGRRPGVELLAGHRRPEADLERLAGNRHRPAGRVGGAGRRARSSGRGRDAERVSGRGGSLGRPRRPAFRRPAESLPSAARTSDRVRSVPSARLTANQSQPPPPTAMKSPHWWSNQAVAVDLQRPARRPSIVPVASRSVRE